MTQSSVVSDVTTISDEENLIHLNVNNNNNDNNNNMESGPLEIDRHDFDCPLCFQLLYEAVTLNCGHTFCRDCLYQAFKFKKHCPICRQHSSKDISNCPSNVLISKILEKYNSFKYKLRGNEIGKIKSLRKSRYPIFISRTPEYPYCQLSLHIFEAKYKAMVTRIMNSDSKFIIACMTHPNGNNNNNNNNNHNNNNMIPHSIGTLCQIKNCQSFFDGRSHIKVIGLKRVKLTNIKLESNSFGLLSAEIDDYLDIKDNDNINHNNNNLLMINDDIKMEDNDNNENHNNNNNDNKFDSFLNFISKLRTNIDENLNFQRRKWLKNNEEKDEILLEEEEKKRTECVALAESDMMDKLLLSVDKFILQEESNKELFYNRVGEPPKNISSYSLWVAGSLPRRLSQSHGINIEISQLQLQILVSRDVSERLQLAQNLATICIQCSQKRSKVQFWIIISIIGLAILYELLNGS